MISSILGRFKKKSIKFQHIEKKARFCLFSRNRFQQFVYILNFYNQHFQICNKKPNFEKIRTKLILI